jgi:hypothetical protein
MAADRRSPGPMATDPQANPEETMSTLTYDGREDAWDRHEGSDEDRMPGRPRRRYATRASAALAAVVLVAVGFYAGVRVEKSQVGSGSGTAGSALASAFATRARAAGAAASGTAAGGTARSGATGAAGAAGSGAAGSGAAAAGGRAGGLGLFGAGGGGAGAPSFGTVSSVSGRTLYLSDASGNTVKVKLSSSTKISKSVAVSRHSIRPGDTVVIQGLKNSTGTVIAATISDSGASGRTTTGSSSSSTGSGGGSRSGVGSLFTPGG